MVYPDPDGNCPHCGAPLGERVDALWQRGGSQVAVRFGAEDLVGFANRGLNVSEGSRAILLKGGALEKNLPPGYHTVQTLGEGLAALFTRRQIEAVLVADGDLTLQLRLGRGRAAEPQPGR
jgi:hypothetical protein